MRINSARRLLGQYPRQKSTVMFVPPPKITEMYAEAGESKFSGINAPTAGARSIKDLPCGNSKILQLYSLATPNGQKVSILLEELAVEYDAHQVNIMESDQFSSGFVDINPNSKIPAAVDIVDGKPVKLFESGSMMLYFADKYQRFISQDLYHRTETLNWLFWQMAGQGPITGNFGHFYAYAPEHEVAARRYGVHRYGMEVQRLCSVLDNHLADKSFLVNEEYSIADMACFPWFQMLRKGGYRCNEYKCSEFLDVAKNYPNAMKWADSIADRDAVKRGMVVCGWNSKHAKPWLHSNEDGM